MKKSNDSKPKVNPQSKTKLKKSIEKTTIAKDSYKPFHCETLQKNEREKCPFCEELFKERIKLLYHLCRNHLTERLCEGKSNKEVIGALDVVAYKCLKCKFRPKSSAKSFAMHFVGNHDNVIYEILKEMNIKKFEIKEDINEVIYAKIDAIRAKNVERESQHQELKAAINARIAKIHSKNEELDLKHLTKPTPEPPNATEFSNDNRQNLNKIIDPSDFSFHFQRAEVKKEIKNEDEESVIDPMAFSFHFQRAEVKNEIKMENHNENDVKSEIVPENVKTEYQANVNIKIDPEEFQNVEKVFESETIEIKREVKIENQIKIEPEQYFDFD